PGMALNARAEPPNPRRLQVGTVVSPVPGLMGHETLQRMAERACPPCPVQASYVAPFRPGPAAYCGGPGWALPLPQSLLTEMPSPTMKAVSSGYGRTASVVRSSSCIVGLSLTTEKNTNALSAHWPPAAMVSLVRWKSAAFCAS